jgi:superfamily I DNA/RNA helicase
MKERLAHLLPDASTQVAVHTFHSLGLEILREQASVVGLHRDFRVAGDAERAAVLAERLALSPRRADELLRVISKAKRTQQAARADVAQALAAYHQELAVRNWVDFDDLVGLAARVLATDADAAARYRERFQWISVDEFQDVDEQQYRWLTLLAPPRRDVPSNLCVIGDPHQAIYGFRGADASCFDRFAQDYPDAVTIRLTRNYRSTGTIVAASAQVILPSEPPTAPSARGARPIGDIVRQMHERITIHAAPTERAEAEFVVQTIERLLGGHSFFSIDSGRATGASGETLGFADFAVLYRTGAQADVLCEAFARSGLPYAKHSHDPLTRQPVVRALLDEWERECAGEPSGRVHARQLEAAAARLARRDGAPDAAAREVALQRLLKLATACAGDQHPTAQTPRGGDPDRARFVDAVALATEADFRDSRADRVSLLTLHAAKGLEFAVVFIVGLEDGVLPLYWQTLGESDAAEERRLFYVGMTRAKHRLILSRAAQRLWRGELRTMSPSPFLRDIEQELVTQARAERRRRKPEDRQLRLL